MLTLRFLIGNLYVNLAPVWKPVCALITSYAEGMDVTQFWDVWGAVLLSAAETVENVENIQSETLQIPESDDFTEKSVLAR